MDDRNPGPQQDLGEATTATPAARGRRRRGSLSMRAAAATVVAGGLAAGSYGVASAASSHGAATESAGQALATASGPATPSKPAPGQPRLGGPGGFGQFGSGGGLGPGSGFGRGGCLGQGGTVRFVSPTAITVDSLFGRAITVKTNSSTVYREGGKKVARSAVVVGEQVMFLPAGRPGGTSPSSSKLVKLVEIVQPHVSGKVVSLKGSQVVVSEQDGLNVTVNTSSSTTYEEAGQPASASDLQVGTVVSVTGTLSSDHDQIDATTVQVVLPSVAGRVTGVSGTTITITSFDGTAETLTTDSSTVFRNSSGTTTIASVAKGDLVEAFGTPGTDSSFAALTVYVGSDVSFGPDGPSAPGGFGGHGGYARAPGWGSWSGATATAGGGRPATD
ncbi:MAG: DUF5666 domain-containing protein [Acidimicrobiales bacterium]